MAEAPGIEVRLFFGATGAVEGSHARRFPAVPTIGQTIVFGRESGTIGVYRVAETGFFAWGRSDEEGGASLWARLEAVPGEHAAPAGFYDPLARSFG